LQLTDLFAAKEFVRVVMKHWLSLPPVDELIAAKEEYLHATRRL